MSLIFDAFKIAKGDSIKKVDLETRKERLKICRECVIDGEWGVLPTGNCRVCGCFVNEKTKYADENCPKLKWFSKE